MFKSLFGKSIKDTTTSTNKTQCIETMRGTLDLINSKCKQLEKQIEKAQALAKQYAKNGDKRSAMLQLKKKAMYTTNLEKIEGQRLNLEMQLINIETMGINSEIINSMRAGNNLMKLYQKEQSLDNIDNIVDDIQDNMDRFNEVSDALSVPLVQMDEDELEAELMDLETEELEKDLLNVDMPTVPDTIPISPNDTMVSGSNSNMSVEEELELLKLDFAI